MRAVERASGRYVVYVDVDLATDLAHLDELVAHVQNGSSISTGSRYARGSQTERKVSRFVTSLVYNSVVRLLLGSSLSDHQCGFKAFDRRALNRLLPHVNSHHWFWDTEVLVRAQAMGFKVAEVPVRWRESSEGTTVRLFHDVPYFLRELIDLRKDLRRQSS